MEQNNIKKILGNSLWQIGEKIITMLISTVVSAIVARYLGVEQFGLVNYVVSTVTLFTAFSTLGMEKITIQDIITETEDESKILGTSFIIRIIGGIILIMISQITLLILNGPVLIYQILGGIMGMCMLFKAFEVIEYYLQAKSKLKQISIIRFITSLIVSAVKFMVVIFDFGVIGYTLSYLIDTIVAGFLLYIYYRNKTKIKWKFNKEYAKNLLKRCWYVAIAGLMTTIYMKIDQVMLGSMLINKFENGIYAAATRIAEMWYFVPMAVIASFQPNIMLKKKNKEEKEYINMMQRLYDMIAIIGIVFAVIISLFGWLAIDILYGAEYMKASEILMISIWAGLFATLGSARSVWLITENLQKYTLIYTGTGAVINIVLNYIMIPKIGAYGAAIATLVAQFISNVISLIPFKKTRVSSFMILKSIFYNQTVLDIAKYLKNKIKREGN